MSCEPNNGTSTGAQVFDNRLRFDSPEIDFLNNVGLTQQAHDTYPAPNSQARFDWMRMYLIALLANQSSCDQPSQYRPGTIWYNLNQGCNSDPVIPGLPGGFFKAFDCTSDAFTDIVNHIKAYDDNVTGPVTLKSFINQIRTLLGQVSGSDGTLNIEYVLYGEVTSTETNQILIPAELQNKLSSDFVPFVYIQNANLVSAGNPYPGMTLVPLNEIVLAPAFDKITFSNIVLTANDLYSVSFKRVSQVFIQNQ